MRKDQPATAR